jgi:hypothetical protein
MNASLMTSLPGLAILRLARSDGQDSKLYSPPAFVMSAFQAR